MAYERQYYTNGDVLDARQMNHMETGIKENSDNIDKLSEEIEENIYPFFKELNVDNDLVMDNNNPLLNEIYMPLTFKKSLILSELRFKLRTTADCVVNFVVKELNGNIIWNNNIELVSGVTNIVLSIDKRVEAKEYQLVFTTDKTCMCFGAHDREIYSDDLFTNKGSVYLYNNSRIRFYGDVVLKSTIKLLYEDVVKITDDISLEKVVENSNGFEKNSLIVPSNDSTMLVINKNGGNITLKRNSDDNSTSWACTEVITPDLTKPFYISFDYNKIEDAIMRVWISDEKTTYSDKAKTIHTLDDIKGSVLLTVNPKDYPMEKFTVWISINSKGMCRISNFRVYQTGNALDTKEILGKNAFDLFKSTDDKLRKIFSNPPKEILVSPNGKKYLLNVSDAGVLNIIPFTPSKGVFFGNSLLLGNGYGMDSSNQESDYYYLINDYIKTNMNQDYVYEKHGASGNNLQFEALTTEITDSELETLFTQYLSSDVDFISIQLGDNVNTAEKLAVFPQNALKLCKKLRSFCPMARIVWHGMWYASDEKYQIIKDACEKTGCEYIFYSDFVSKKYNSYIGHVHNGTSGERKLENVIEVFTHDDGTISALFTIGSDSTIYETDNFVANNYSLNGTTLTYTGTAIVTTNSGVASHPSDKGFKKIANKVLYKLRYTDDEDYYEVD